MSRTWPITRCRSPNARAMKQAPPITSRSRPQLPTLEVDCFRQRRSDGGSTRIRYPNPAVARAHWRRGHDQRLGAASQQVPGPPATPRSARLQFSHVSRLTLPKGTATCDASQGIWTTHIYVVLRMRRPIASAGASAHRFRRAVPAAGRPQANEADVRPNIEAGGRPMQSARNDGQPEGRASGVARCPVRLARPRVRRATAGGGRAHGRRLLRRPSGLPRARGPQARLEKARGGAPGRTRTDDARLRTAALYSTELRGPARYYRVGSIGRASVTSAAAITARRQGPCQPSLPRLRPAAPQTIGAKLYRSRSRTSRPIASYILHIHRTTAFVYGLCR